MTRRLTILAAVAALATSAAASSASASTHLTLNLENTMVSGYVAKAPSPGQTTAATSNGIIMHGNGLCDPIRHIGC